MFILSSCSEVIATVYQHDQKDPTFKTIHYEMKHSPLQTLTSLTSASGRKVRVSHLCMCMDIQIANICK